MARVLVGVLGGALVSGAGVWMLFGSQLAERPDRAEVIGLVETYSPYNIDQSLINHVMEAQQEQLDELEEKVDEVRRGQAEISVVLAALSKQLDSIEQKLDER